MVNETILSNYQRGACERVGCEVQALAVLLKQLFPPSPPPLPPLVFFFGFKSSALDLSKPSGQRLRCIQNFNVPLSIVYFRECCQVPWYLPHSLFLYPLATSFPLYLFSSLISAPHQLSFFPHLFTVWQTQTHIHIR